MPVWDFRRKMSHDSSVWCSNTTLRSDARADYRSSMYTAKQSDQWSLFYENPNAMASGDRTSPPIGSDGNQAFRGERLIPVLGLLLTENIKYGAHNLSSKEWTK